MFLSWESLVYELREGIFGSKKTVLHGISGYVREGELLAIIGPSGAGKTSLLSLLSGQSERSAGRISLNGFTVQSSRLARCSKVVFQDECLFATMTVKEHLTFAAKMRLSGTRTDSEISEVVKRIIESLRLRECKSNLIGDHMIPGISGGQARRVTIGMELVDDSPHQILFLDEPTTGLDSTSAGDVVRILKDFASQGHIVICSIHQPSTDMFSQFDKLLLVSQGHQCFFGPPLLALEFFTKTMKHEMEAFVSPSDFLVERIAVSTPEVKAISSAYMESEYFKHSVSKNDPTLVTDTKFPRANAAPVLRQFPQLLWRFTVEYMRNPYAFNIRAFLFVSMAFICGTEALLLPFDYRTLPVRIAMCWLPIGFMSWFPLGQIGAFLIDGKMFLRQRQNNYFSVPVYYIAQSLVKLIFVGVQTMLFCLMFYFLINFDYTVEKFFYFFLIVVAMQYFSESFVQLLALLIPDFPTGVALFSIFYIAMHLGCGWLVVRSAIPSHWIWFFWMDPVTYGFSGVMNNEFRGNNYTCANVTNEFTNITGCSCIFPDLNGDCVQQGSEVISYYGFSIINKWLSLGVLWSYVGVMNFFYYLLLYFYCTKKRYLFTY